MSIFYLRVPIEIKFSELRGSLGNYPLIRSELVDGCLDRTDTYDIVADSPSELYSCCKLLQTTHLSLQQYRYVINDIRSRYPVKVSGEFRERDWRVLDKCGYAITESHNWVTDLVQINKGSP